MAANDFRAPQVNLSIYSVLYAIEVGLREFIISRMDSACGPRWMKQRLPEDVYKTYKDGIEAERRVPWPHLVPHHGIYYVNFADLQKIITRNDNWEEVFGRTFKNKETLRVQLAMLEPVRNKIAHNRRGLAADVDLLDAALQFVAGAIGRERFDWFVAKCTTAEGLTEAIDRLREEAYKSFLACNSFSMLTQLTEWDRTCRCWWYDGDYLGQDLSPITTYFEALIRYQGLSRRRGQGYIIEAWVKEADIGNLYQSAAACLSTLISTPNEV